MHRYMETVIMNLAQTKKSMVLNYPIDDIWNGRKMVPGFKTEILKLIDKYKSEFPDNRFEVAGFSIALGAFDKEKIKQQWSKILKVEHLIASSCKEKFVHSQFDFVEHFQYDMETIEFGTIDLDLRKFKKLKILTLTKESATIILKSMKKD